MKEYTSIVILFSYLICANVSLLKANPLEITKLSEKEFDKKISMSINTNDPIGYLKLKDEIMHMYSARKLKDRIKRIPKKVITKTDLLGRSAQEVINGPSKDHLFGSQRFTEVESGNRVSIVPMDLGKKGSPSQREYHSDEELVPIVKLSADSIYIKYKGDEIIEKFDPKNVLSSENFWCSAGNHGLKDEIKFNVEFERSYRMNAMWIHWAFAPGEFKIRFSNDNQNFYDLFNGYRYSIKEGNANWWKSILSNSKTRWAYKSFDERINFSEPIWGKYVEITMKIPVNQYFGIYKLEFYTKNKSIVMIKSLKPQAGLCLSVSNGALANYSPVVGSECLQGIGFGDNRDVWILNSNGYITTFRENKCLESPTTGVIDIVDCGIAADYRDDREKWIIDYDGKIRSSQQQSTCISLVDDSVPDLIPVENIKPSASSTQSDGLHNPERALDSDVGAFWASNPSKIEVIYEVYFPNFPYVIKNLKIEWKFPAKKYKVIGLMLDGFWKDFKHFKNNRETINYINTSNYELLGLKIIMLDSTTKFEELNIYGISKIDFHIGSTYLNREPCKDILNNANLWSIIDVNFTDEVAINEYKKAWAILHKSRTTFKILTIIYKKVPGILDKLNEKASILKGKIIDVYATFQEIQMKILRFEDFLKSEKMKVFTLAANKYFPASDCAHIIKAYPSKRSGFYWIKNDCTPKPLRVYCDFDSYNKKGGLDFIVYNREKLVNTPMRGIKKYADIRKECAKIGLEPLQFKNLRMIKIVHYLLRKQKYNLKDKLIVPLAYDYNCDISKCSGKYKSLNDENSFDINDYLKQLTVGGSVSNLLSKSVFDDNGHQIRNVAGFGINDIIVYLKLEDYPVSAIICSTNDNGSNKSKPYAEIDCDTNLKGDSFSEYELFTNLRVICPRNCGSSSSQVFGNGIYTDNSSICKAAIHAGFIKDSEGGTIEINLEPGQKNYIGSTANNIESMDYPNEWDRSFRVKHYKPNCPIDKIKELLLGDKKSSFISLNESIKEGNSLIEAFKIPENASNSKDELLKEFYSFLQYKKNLGKKETKNSYNPSFRFNSNESKTQTLQSRRFADNSFFRVKENAPAKKEESKSYVAPKFEQTVSEAIVALNAQKSSERKYIKFLKNFGNDFKTIIGKLVYRTKILTFDKEIGTINQKKVYDSIKRKVNVVKKKIFEISRKSQQRVIITEHNLQKSREKINEFILSDQFIEDYSNSNIRDNYIIYNSLKGLGKPPKWDYYMYNLDGHQKTISQKGSFIDSKSGSHLILKNRNFFDFEARFSVLIQDNNTFGFAFRYKDPYNYYIFEMSNQEKGKNKIKKGFKRIRKFEKGSPSIIDIKYTGGYLMNTWYNIKIRAQNSNIVIYMTDQKENIEKRFEKIFDFNDNEIMQGTIAFTSLGNKFLLIDNISIIPIACTNFDDREGASQLILTPTCPRFTEDYKNDFISRWSVIDPIETTEGPSMWIRIYEAENREVVLAQKSSISGVSQFEEGTIFLLKQGTKVCSQGKYSIKFKATSDGIIGMVFRYSDKGDYYILEISGEREKFLRFRKKMGAVYQLISSKPNSGYNLDQWYSVTILMNENKFNVYMTNENIFEKPEKVFEEDIQDPDLKMGFVGLSTYKTPAFFSDISLNPLDNLEEKESLLYVDEESLDLPKKKINTLIGKLSMNIENFTWGKCLIYPNPEDRLRYCDVLFQSKQELQLCKNDFCKTCCFNSVDSTNKLKTFICEKQCRMMESGNNKTKKWENCFEPSNQGNSVYPYCDKLFENDYFQNTRCKLDFCNLCCVSLDNSASTNLSQSLLAKCYENCINTFNSVPYKNFK